MRNIAQAERGNCSFRGGSAPPTGRPPGRPRRPRGEPGFPGAAAPPVPGAREPPATRAATPATSSAVAGGARAPSRSGRAPPWLSLLLRGSSRDGARAPGPPRAALPRGGGGGRCVGWGAGQAGCSGGHDRAASG